MSLAISCARPWIRKKNQEKAELKLKEEEEKKIKRMYVDLN